MIPTVPVMSSVPDHVELAGLSFRSTSFEQLDASVRAHLRYRDAAPRRSLVIGFINPHVVTTAADDPALADHVASCDHVCVDGVGVRLAMLARGVRVERLPAHRAFDRLVARGSLTGAVALIGLEADEIELAADSLRRHGLDVVAAIDGFATDDQILAALDRLDRLDAIVVGAGTPRSESIVELVRGRTAPVVFHAGAGTLKVHAGVRRHPHRFIAALGLDWVVRLVVEPHTRPRYLKGIPRFIRLVFARPPRSSVPATGAPS